MSYKDRLAKIGNAWKKARPQGGGGSVPAGTYQAKIEKAFLKEKNDHMFFNVQLNIITGEYTGRKLFRNTDLDYVRDGEYIGLGFLKKDLETLGVECDDISQLESVGKEILDLVVECNVVVNSKGYTNTYINKLIHSPESAVEDDEDEEEKPAPKKKAKSKAKKKEPEPEDEADDEWDDDEWDDE